MRARPSSLLLLVALLGADVRPAKCDQWPHPDALKFTCSDRNFAPLRLSKLSEGRGNKEWKYILVPPVSIAGDLCTVTRVNYEERKVFIPIARSYVSHDGDNDWQRTAGRYVTDVEVTCDTTANVGPINLVLNDNEWQSGEYLCQLALPPLGPAHDGYYLQTRRGGDVSPRTTSARFLERTTWGATWEEITALEHQIETDGTMALASWVHHQVGLPPTSHRAYFRRRLNPRTVESYQYGVPGPKACERDARFRRFAFTYHDVELSRGQNSPAGNNGHPYTTMTVTTDGADYEIRFGGEVRTVLDAPLQYDEGGTLIDLADGEYTICSVSEVVGNHIGDSNYTYTFQVLVGDLCTSSFTNRGNIADGKGDGSLDSENRRVSGSLVRHYDSSQCNSKCGDSSKVKYIVTGNPEVRLPGGYDTSDLSWINLSGMNSTELVNLDPGRTHDSSWLLRRDLDDCADENGDVFPDPAGLANTDFMSTGRGKL